MADVDHFKNINDTCGHPTGDRLLMAIAQVLRASLRDVDTVGRWGGDEFLIILPGTPIDRGMRVAEKLRLAIGDLDAPAVGHVTAGFGVTTCQPNDSEVRILARADEALYAAKEHGRNRVALMTDGLPEFPDRVAPGAHAHESAAKVIPRPAEDSSRSGLAWSHGSPDPAR